MQSVGLWNPVTNNPFSVSNKWHWTTDAWNNNSSYGWLIYLGTNTTNWNDRSRDDWNWYDGNGYSGTTFNYYALCGPK